MKNEIPVSFDNVAQTVRGETGRADEPTLAGRRAWIISDGIAGHLAITSGIAETLGLDVEIIEIAPRWPWRHLAPNGPADPRILRPLRGKAPPDIVLGAGRQTVPFIRALRSMGLFTVIFQSPRASRKSADLIWVPAHDRLRGPNVIATLTPPNRFSAVKLDELRRNAPEAITALAGPRAALLLGGPGAGYSYDAAAVETFAASLGALADRVGSFLVTPSRRTPPSLLKAADEATSGRPRIFWNGMGENPYPQFLASADLFIVTADSVNMTGEACATGRPVYVFTPPGGRAKFQRFHCALEEYGATRPLPRTGEIDGNWRYEPLHAAAIVASEIETRWRRHQSTAPGR